MLKSVSFTNFRNFEKKTVEFGEGVNVINAPNATGKTNILEGIYFASTGKSFKAKREEEVIRNEAEIANVLADLRFMNEDVRLAATLTRGAVNIGKETLEKIPKKKLLVNGIPRRLIDFAGNLKTTLFLPEDIDLVTGSPSKRRNYLDQVISQVDRNYRRSVLIYERGVRQRNKILLKIREEGISRNHLLFWNQILIKNGNYITESRQKFIEFTNSIDHGLGTLDYRLEYDSSLISENRLEQYKVEEVAAGTTLVGPHRDDFAFSHESQVISQSLASYGSRGEQRMGVLWLKMAEIKFIEEKTGVKPTLLLDDIFSELDHEHRKIVVDMIQGYQSIITSADEHNIAGIMNGELRIKNINL
jgi:DNA replication and repair protein RecF